MDTILSQVLELQGSKDLSMRNDFIEKYRPFIVNTVSRTTGQYVRSEDSDEYAIGLEAFNEAIDKYMETKGTFIHYAQLVIRSRVTDYLRKEYRYHGKVMTNETYLEEVSTNVDEDLVLEIRAFESCLGEFDITFDHLASVSPKHRTTKKEVIGVGHFVYETKELCKKLYKTRKLPMAAIMRVYEVTKKRLKTYRDYIIAVVIIYKEEFQLIETYLAVRGDKDA